MNSDQDKPQPASTDREWLANICEFLANVDALSEQEVKEALRGEGIDPEALVKRGLAFLGNQRKQATYRMLGEAREKQKQILDKLMEITPPSGAMADLKAKLRAKWDAWSSHGSPQMALAFRNLDAQTEDDLRSLLADIERLERLAAEENQ